MPSFSAPSRAALTGDWEIERFSRAGVYLGTIRGGNAITAAGLALFLDLVRGATGNFLNNNLQLELLSGAPATIKTITATDAGYPQATGTARQLRWQWTDNTTDSYTVATLKLHRSGTEFSSATPSFGGGNTKPTNEIWRYRYTLTIGGDSRFSEPAPDFGSGGLYPGLENMLHRAAGLSSGYLWEAGNVEARIYTAAGYGNHQATLTGPIVSRVGSSTLRYVYTAGSGAANVNWQWMAVVNIFDTDTFLRILNQNHGVKSTGATWTWTYDFSIS